MEFCDKMRVSLWTLFGIGFVLLAFVLPAALYAQKAEITVLGGWQWSGKVNTDEGDIKVSDPGNFEAAIGYYIKPGIQAELSYTYTKAVATFDPDPGSTIPEGFLSEIAVHYFLVSGLKEIPLKNKKIVPYGLGSLGAVYFHPTKSVYEDTWRFAFGFGAGTKIYVSERFGIRLQARLLMPVYFSGAGFWFGTGGGGIGVGGGIPILQGDLSGGLIARF